MGVADRKWPLVSVITVNYNQSGVTAEFLTSFGKITYPETEVFVVDNASRADDRAEALKEKFPFIHFIQNRANLGFAAGNNAALPFCRGKYVLFINNDTEVEKGFLEPLVEVLESDPSIAMVSPKIHYFHTPDTFQFGGFTRIHPITIRNFALGFGEKDRGQFDMTCETGSIFGAAMLVSMEAIRKVGMMAENFFLYYEEHDWAEHMKKAGYKIYYQGKSLVLHKESISTIKESPFQIFYLTRGRILFARRNNLGWIKFLSLFYLYTVAIPKQALRYLLKGRLDLSRASWKSAWWHWTHYRNIYGLPPLKENKR